MKPFLIFLFAIWSLGSLWADSDVVDRVEPDEAIFQNIHREAQQKLDRHLKELEEIRSLIDRDGEDRLLKKAEVKKIKKFRRRLKRFRAHCRLFCVAGTMPQRLDYWIRVLGKWKDYRKNNVKKSRLKKVKQFMRSSGEKGQGALAKQLKKVEFISSEHFFSRARRQLEDIRHLNVQKQTPYKIHKIRKAIELFYFLYRHLVKMDVVDSEHLSFRALEKPIQI